MAGLRQTLSRWAGADRAARLHHLPFVLFIAALLAYGGDFAAYMLFNFDVLDMTANIRDDAFYYFQIAWNMAQGRFSTFDGGITQTNGYHPLWLFLITPFYWFLDKEGALSAIRALEIMLIAGGVACIAAAAKLCRLPWWLLFAALPLLYRQEALLLGMEAAAALFMLGLLFLGLALFAGNPQRWKGPLAALCFALPWVRLEYIAIALAVAVVLGLFEFPQWRRASGGGLRAGVRSFHALGPLLGGVAGILVYFAYNGLVFGGPVPVSGATKIGWSQVIWQRDGGYNFAENLAAVWGAAVFDWEVAAALTVCLWLVPLWWLARRPESGQERLLFAFMLGAFGVAVGHLAMFGYQAVAVHPEHIGRFEWYYVPAYLLMALLVPLHGYAALGLIRRGIRPRWPRAAKPLQAAVILCAVTLLFIQSDFAYPWQFVKPPLTGSPYWTPHSLSRYSGSLMANRGLPDGSVIGSFDAGTIGYFSRFPVVNLDGLVNSYDYLRATAPRARRDPWLPGGGSLPSEMQGFGITHLVNNTRPHTWEGAIFNSGWYFDGGRLRTVLNIRPAELGAAPDAAAEFAARLAASTGQPDNGASLAIDGRLAQAFAPGCAAEELLVWVYANGESPEVQFPDITTYHSPRGWCTTARVLPYAIAPPVRVEARTVEDYLAQLRPLHTPDAEAPFDLYLISGPPGNYPHLLYAKDQCRAENLEAWAVLHLFPRSLSDLPETEQAQGYGNHDFRFQHHSAQFGDWCLAAVPLKQGYAVSHIRTGQWLPEENRRRWEAEFHFPP